MQLRFEEKSVPYKDIFPHEKLAISIIANKLAESGCIYCGQARNQEHELAQWYAESKVLHVEWNNVC